MGFLTGWYRQLYLGRHTFDTINWLRLRHLVTAASMRGIRWILHEIFAFEKRQYVDTCGFAHKLKHVAIFEYRSSTSFLSNLGLRNLVCLFQEQWNPDFSNLTGGTNVRSKSRVVQEIRGKITTERKETAFGWRWREIQKKAGSRNQDSTLRYLFLKLIEA